MYPVSLLFGTDDQYRNPNIKNRDHPVGQQITNEDDHLTDHDHKFDNKTIFRSLNLFN